MAGLIDLPLSSLHQISCVYPSFLDIDLSLCHSRKKEKARKMKERKNASYFNSGLMYLACQEDYQSVNQNIRFS